MVCSSSTALFFALFSWEVGTNINKFSRLSLSALQRGSYEGVPQKYVFEETKWCNPLCQYLGVGLKESKRIFEHKCDSIKTCIRRSIQKDPISSAIWRKLLIFAVLHTSLLACFFFIVFNIYGPLCSLILMSNDINRQWS